MPNLHGPLWAVTSYFNPMGYGRRLANYRAFRRHLAVPLATIEWSIDGRFELADDDADLVLRVDGGSLLWQKERLLNLLVPRLPGQCHSVAWLDCDIIFQRDDWPEAALRALDRWPMVQLFDTVRHSGPVPLAEVPQRERWFNLPAFLERKGLVAAIPRDRPLAEWAQERPPRETEHGNPTTGFAWAAHRELLQAIPLLDVWVCGGADSAMCFAALGVPERVVRRHQLAGAHRDHYLDRARALAAAVAGEVGHVPGTIHALWHGDLDDRRYKERHALTAAHGFDPGRFLRLAPSGVWQWTEVAGGLAADVREYFRRRNEDGALLPAPAP
jgi:hypothetical protein